MLSGCSWEVGQFDPNDLRRIKQLVMGRRRSAIADFVASIGSLFPLLPNLRQVFFEEWDQEELDNWFGSTDEKTRNVHSTRQIWKCVPPEEIDAAIVVYSSYETSLPFHTDISAASLGSFLSDIDKKSRSYSYFEDLAKQFEDILSERRQDHRRRSDADWNIPKVAFVHVCSESIAQRFVQGRLAFWHYYRELKEAYARDKSFTPLMVDGPVLPSPFRVDWISNPHLCWFAEHVEYILGGSDNYPLPLGHTEAELPGWYLAKSSACKPSLEIL